MKDNCLYIKQESSAEIQVRNNAFISLRKMGKEKKAIKDGRFVSEWLLLFTAVQRNQGTQSVCFIPLFLLPCRLEYLERWWLRIHGRKINAYAK